MAVVACLVMLVVSVTAYVVMKCLKKWFKFFEHDLHSTSFKPLVSRRLICLVQKGLRKFPGIKGFEVFQFFANADEINRHRF